MSAPQLPKNIKILSVSALTEELKSVLEDGFSNVWVAGEISNLTRPSSGHIYLTLKDAEAQIRAVIWRSSVLRLRCEPKLGMEVVVVGRLAVYAPRGEYQLVIERLLDKGAGTQDRKLRELREKLHRLGYFAPDRKKPLPAYPRRLALVTSPSGAAVRDMLQILAQRWPATEVIVCPVRVQGDGAAEEVAESIQLLNRLHQSGSLAVDVMIVGRGGGSAEDLSAFNEECVAHAIFHSCIPVVSAVGHEVDVTIADLVADRRALTPSEAATAVVPSRDEIGDLVQGLRQRLGDLLSTRLTQQRRFLDALSGRRVFRQPLERVHDLEQKLDEWTARLQRGVRQRFERSRTQLTGQAARLEALSPLNVLARGYSLTVKESDQVLVRTPEQVQPGDRLITRLERGRLVSRVEEVEAGTPTDSRKDMDGPVLRGGA